MTTAGVVAGVTGLACVVIDCAGPEPLARWWQGLLGGDVTLDDDGDASLHVAGAPRIDFLRVPEPKSVKDRLHLDLATDDFDVAVAATLAHGATAATDIYTGEHFAVFRDPEGNEFCLLRPGWDEHRQA